MREVDRPTALSPIGTAIGIAGAGAVALAMVLTGLSWHWRWAGFAGAAALALAANWAALRTVERSPKPGPEEG